MLKKEQSRFISKNLFVFLFGNFLKHPFEAKLLWTYDVTLFTPYHEKYRSTNEMTICLLRIDMKKVSYLQIIAVSTSQKKPVGHSIGMIWNATGSFFLSRSIRTLNMSSKQTKEQKCYFRLKTCILQQISHTLRIHQYILQTNNVKINISIMIIM